MQTHFASSRALILAAALLGGTLLSFQSAHAATISVNDGATTYKCTLGNLSVNSTGNVSANVSACSPALGGTGSGGDGGGGGSPGTGDGSNPDTGGGGSNPDTGGGSNPGTGGGTGSADPGSGLWSPDPAATPVVYVVDQSLNRGEPVNLTRLPGCLNGASLHNGAACTSSGVYNASLAGKNVALRLTEGQIISVRYRPVDAPGTVTGSITLSNSVGGSIVMNTTMSLSTTPGDMSPSNSRCVTTGTTTPRIITGSSYCPVSTANPVYYLNIRVNRACTSCTWMISESSKSFEM